MFNKCLSPKYKSFMQNHIYITSCFTHVYNWHHWTPSGSIAIIQSWAEKGGIVHLPEMFLDRKNIIENDLLC